MEDNERIEQEEIEEEVEELEEEVEELKEERNDTPKWAEMLIQTQTEILKSLKEKPQKQENQSQLVQIPVPQTEQEELNQEQEELNQEQEEPIQEQEEPKKESKLKRLAKYLF